jgi:hypothetical protein
MLIWTGLALLVLGVVVWFFGNRLWLLAAGAGALLGVGLLRLFPGMAGGGLGFLLVGALAIGLGVLGFLGRAFSKTIALIIGFVAGGGIALGLFDALGLNLGFWGWIVALLAAGIGALLFVRFLDWALILFAGLIGSTLVVRGVLSMLPSLTGALAGLAIVVLTALGIFYHYRKSHPKSDSQPATAS